MLHPRTPFHLSLRGISILRGMKNVECDSMVGDRNLKIICNEYFEDAVRAFGVSTAFDGSIL